MNKIKKYNHIIFSWIIIFINLCLNMLFISKEGYSNEYYSAAVKSMLINFKNFFFASFDPTGFLTVDKPPLGLWLQAISVKIFGLNTFSLLLPSAISSAIVCFLIYKIMSQSFGAIYGLIAEFAFCFTPIVIAVSRTNNLDMTLMLFMMLSIYFTIKSCNQKNFSFFLLAMLMLGFAFNIKMLQAYMILPAIFIYFIISNKISLKTFYKCIISGCLLLIISFSWTIVTELTPKNNRPFIGGSGSDNSVITLMFGHNGFERLTGKKNNGNPKPMDMPKQNYSNLPKLNDYNKPPQFPNNNFKMQSKGFDETGNLGLLRLFDFTGASMYEQISWLLIPSLFCIIAILFYKKFTFLSHEQIKIIILWSLCLLPMLIFFNVAGFFHRYYLAMMAPSIACLFSAICYIVQNTSEKKFKVMSYILFGITFSVQLYFVFKSKIYFLVITMLIEILLLLISSLLIKNKLPIIFLSAILTAPVVYSFYPLFTNINSTMPAVEVGNKKFFNDTNRPKDNNKSLLEFLIKNQSDEKYFLAVSNCNEASSLILNTNLPVISVNGFEGTDNTINLDKLKSMIKNKEIKYYMIADSHFNQSEINDWIEKNAKLVYTDKVSGDSPQSHNGHKIYDLTYSSSSLIS